MEITTWLAKFEHSDHSGTARLMHFPRLSFDRLSTVVEAPLQHTKQTQKQDDICSTYKEAAFFFILRFDCRLHDNRYITCAARIHFRCLFTYDLVSTSQRYPETGHILESTSTTINANLCCIRSSQRRSNVMSV